MELGGIRRYFSRRSAAILKLSSCPTYSLFANTNTYSFGERHPNYVINIGNLLFYFKAGRLLVSDAFSGFV